DGSDDAHQRAWILSLPERRQAHIDRDGRAHDHLLRRVAREVYDGRLPEEDVAARRGLRGRYPGVTRGLYLGSARPDDVGCQKLWLKSGRLRRVGRDGRGRGLAEEPREPAALSRAGRGRRARYAERRVRVNDAGVDREPRAVYDA